MADILGKAEEQNVVEPKLSKKEKQKKLQEELAELEDRASEDDSPHPDEKIEKPKKPRSAKQIETLARANEIRKEKVKIRLEQRQKEEVEQKKVTERKIIDKAIKLKKKQIRHAKVLEDSDSDTEEEQAPVGIPPRPVKNPLPISIGGKVPHTPGAYIPAPERKIRFV